MPWGDNVKEVPIDAVPQVDEDGPQAHVRLLEVIPAIFIGFLLNTVLIGSMPGTAAIRTARTRNFAHSTVSCGQRPISRNP